MLKVKEEIGRHNARYRMMGRWVFIKDVCQNIDKLNHFPSLTVISVQESEAVSAQHFSLEGGSQIGVTTQKVHIKTSYPKAKVYFYWIAGKFHL